MFNFIDRGTHLKNVGPGHYDPHFVSTAELTLNGGIKMKGKYTLSMYKSVS